MINREARRALEDVQRSIDELTRTFDEAAGRAAQLGATDILEHLNAAKAGTLRGADCLNRVRVGISPPEGDDTD